MPLRRWALQAGTAGKCYLDRTATGHVQQAVDWLQKRHILACNSALCLLLVGPILQRCL